MKKIFLICISIVYCFISNSQTDYFTDKRDGRVYKTIKIDEQIWMAENLNSAFYFDGTPIELITSNDTWSKSLFGYSYYDFNETIQKQNGNLYKYFTATDVCPFNWHLPSNYEWDKMLIYLGKNKTDYHYRSQNEEIFLAGNELKVNDPSLWQFWKRRTGDVIESEQNISNKSGFSAMPSGVRLNSGEFAFIGYETYFWSGDYSLDSYSDNFGLGNYSLLFDNNQVKKQINPLFSYGLSVRCVKDELNPNLTKAHDSLNQFSFSKQNWNTLTTNNEVVSINAKQLKNSKPGQLVLEAFKKNVLNVDENKTYVSPLSKNKKYFSLILDNEEQSCVYFFNIEKQTFHQLNLCNQILWLSYSPNQEFILYKTSPERFPDDLTVYEIESNELNYIDFYKQGFAKNKVGYIAPYEILRLDETSVNWINQFEFEVIANIYSEMEDFEGAKIEEIPAKELRDDSRSATYIYTYNIKLKKIIKVIIIK